MWTNDKRRRNINDPLNSPMNVSERSSFYIRKLRVISLKVNATHSLYVHPCHSCDCVVVVRVCPWGVGSGNTPWKSWQCLEGRRERECYRGCFGWSSWRLRPLWQRCCSRTDRNCLGCHRWIWPPPLGEFDRSCLGRSRRLIGYIGGLWFSLFFCFDYGFIVDYYSKISLYIDCIIIYQWQKKLIIVEY